ncbi:restriction endonuclease subunit S [Reyranella sp.]|uniref:restriction endonuclease subunit S n=1 Tax=Reyranella sp. TaxID=1929291 RepID=UPI003BAB3B32
MGEWVTDTVINLQSRGILRVEDGNHGEARPRPDEFVDVGVAYIRAADMANGSILFDSASKINRKARERITKGIGKPGDILISHKGTVGRIARAPINAPDFVCSPQTTFWRSTNEEILSQDFLYSYVRSPKFSQEFLVRSGETDMAGYVSLTSQRCLVLSIPPIELQRPIGALMSALDEKIELNRQMNETLEAMARAVFKDWFVDFGPTRAKIERRAPYLTPDIWSLFPDRLDDDGKPEGWVLGAMTDLIMLQRGFDLPSQARTDGQYPIIAASGPSGCHNSYMVKGPGVVTGRSGVLGNVFFVHEDFWPLNTSLWVREFRRATPSFAYFYLCGIDFAAFNAGSAVPTLNRNHVHGLSTVLPPDSLVKKFDETVMPLLRLQENNRLETKVVGDTRDFLLPKLMSGEVRLKDAERLVSEAT